MTLSHNKSTERMSMIVRHENTIYLSGQTAGSTDLNVAAQTSACLGKIDALLAEAGTERCKIISALIHVKSMTDFAEMNQVWDAWVADIPKPARTCVEATMARAEVLVEVTIVAAA
jgi:enamine deaminase RidA (YjgF/YER057c/UK114 family)